MSVIVIDEIFDPIGNSQQHKQVPTVHWQYVGMECKYGVQINWQLPQEEQSMYYTVDMHCSGTQEGKGIWEITKDNFYIDNKKPEDHISLLAIASATTYYPFEFSATKNGKIDSILNTDKLQKRFTEAKPILLRDFSGDVAKEYIETVEKSLRDQEILKSIVTKDIWLLLFFADIIGEYDYETGSREMSIEFPFTGFEGLLVFKGLAKIDRRNENMLTIIFDGMLKSSDTIENILTRSGTIEIKYHIDIPSYSIRNIDCIARVTIAAEEYKLFVKGCKKTERKIVQQKEEKLKSEPVGWMAFFNKV